MRFERDSDGTATAAANGDLPVPHQDCQARAESIAKWTVAEQRQLPMTEELIERVTRLDEFDQAEWRDVTRKLRPDWRDGQFDDAWERFQAEKLRRASQ